ncbi:hypothetical protein MMC13_004673 [Lambiella insularis]|nr:hypothetical protein [Lambiella insularis]
MHFSTATVLAFVSVASSFAAASTRFERRNPAPEADFDDYYSSIHARSAYADLDDLRLQARDVYSGFEASDIYARDAEPEDDFDVYARDVYPSYHTQYRRITPAKGNAVLNLVKANQASKVAPARANGDMRAVGFHAGTAQRINQAQGHDTVAPPRPPPHSYADAQSQAHSRAWGDDPRGGHRGGGAPSHMRTGF